MVKTLEIGDVLEVKEKVKKLAFNKFPFRLGEKVVVTKVEEDGGISVLDYLGDVYNLNAEDAKAFVSVIEEDSLPTVESESVKIAPTDLVSLNMKAEKFKNLQEFLATMGS